MRWNEALIIEVDFCELIIQSAKFCRLLDREIDKDRLFN